MTSVRLLGVSLLLLAAFGSAACSASSDDPATSDESAEVGGNEQDLRGVKKCGGLTGQQCTGSTTCVDDPIDSCDPSNGGADCVGLCVNTTKAQPCGGIAGVVCGEGYRCVDNPNDGCQPARGVDCMGICVKAVCNPKLALTVSCNDGYGWDPMKCACTQVKLGCATLRCASGFHCEDQEAGPLCVKNDLTDCRTNGCDAGKYCSACWGSFACIPNGAMC